MASDNGAAVLANLVTAVSAVSKVGRVFNYLPVWNTPAEMTEATKVIIDGVPRHRFVTIQQERISEPFTSGSDLVMHHFMLEVWVSALLDKGFALVSTTEARTLVAAILTALRDQSVLSTGDTYCGYPEDGIPQETDMMEFRKLLDKVFHVATIELTTREEVAHA
jgi:hypothetical protein